MRVKARIDHLYLVPNSLKNTLYPLKVKGPCADCAAGLAGRRWIGTALFGLVHGFGFSSALQERLQFAGAHLLTSLLSFNV